MKIEVHAPGRVNLIGEHTDYNMGFVLPMAINRGINLKAASRNDHLVNIYARDLKEEATVSLLSLNPGDKKNWWDYIGGTCWAIKEAGYELKGADIEFGGDLPIGAGLSSSAALEVAVAAAFNELYNLGISRKDIALICQKAENNYVGVKCGVMDQFASALCEESKALFIDCRSNEYLHVPLDIENFSFVIVDSRVKRSLSGSAYNKRRAECEEALNIINSERKKTKKSLREFTLEDIDQSKKALGKILFNRSSFIFEENQRVIKSVETLKNGNLVEFGNLMDASHEGLRDLFEVSCEELDIIVEKAKEVPGVLGARMTGAGFGGCVVSILYNEVIEDFKKNILKRTRKAFSQEPAFYITPPSNGFSIK